LFIKERTAAEASLRRQLRDATQERNLALAQLKHLEHTAAVRGNSSSKKERPSAAPGSVSAHAVAGTASSTPPRPKPPQDAQDVTGGRDEKKAPTGQWPNSDLSSRSHKEHHHGTSGIEPHAQAIKGRREGRAASARVCGSDDSDKGDEEASDQIRSDQGVAGTRNSRRASRQSNRELVQERSGGQSSWSRGDSKSGSRGMPMQRNALLTGSDAISSRLAGLAALTDAILSSDSD